MRLILKNELKKAFKMKYVIGFILIALVLQGFIQFGNLKHFDNIENRISFQEAERAKVSHYTMFRQYATFGIITMFVPSQFGILYNDSTFDLLVSNANIGDMFDIYLPKKGKELFSINSPFMNFMGMSLLLLFLFGILYGKDTTINKAYLKFLSSQSGTKKVLWFIIFFRLILLNAAFLLMFVINISVLLLNNINLFRLPLLPFCWGLFLVISLSFSIGCFLGTIKSNFKRNAAFFVIYFLSVILLVLFLNFITTLNAGDIKPVFEFNNDNLKAVMLEEENMVKKHGVLPRGRKPTEEETIDARQSLFKYNKKIRENLDELKHKLESKIKTRKFIASLFPTLFYFSICEDASTNSNDSFIDFFDFSKKRKQEFVLFCVDKIFPYPIPKELPKIENFIKDNEDLFFARSKIPRNFWLGSIISILWIAGFLLTAYRRALKQIKGEPGKIRAYEVKMKSDKFNYLLTADTGLKNQVYNSLTGDGYTTIQITMDEKALEHKDIIYVYETERFLKDVDQGCLYKELLGKEMPGDVKPWECIIQYVAHTKKILLLDDFFNGMNMDDIDEFIETVKKTGINVLYIGGEFFQSCYLDVDLIICPNDLSIPGVAERIRAVRKRRAKNQ
jgi:hypothetical protein